MIGWGDVGWSFCGSWFFFVECINVCYLVMFLNRVGCFIKEVVVFFYVCDVCV